MAGHSKWSKVKRSKGALDVKRGKIFSRLAKEIMVAVRLGGADGALNARLRSAILAAKAQNMPGDTIERAVKRASGGNGSASLEEMIYEGYAAGGVAVLVECATDNKNRTAADLRSIFSKQHGHLAASGAVSYLFKRKGQITVPGAELDEDQLMEVAGEAGAEDFAAESDGWVITTAHDELYQVAELLRQREIKVESQKLVFLPDSSTAVHSETVARQVLRLLDALEDSDDVQNVFSNLEISDELLTSVAD